MRRLEDQPPYRPRSGERGYGEDDGLGRVRCLRFQRARGGGGLPDKLLRSPEGNREQRTETSLRG
jgi:hypothetical protein